MAQELEELPLFPLGTVLFPYASLQLHVFEPRYREMVEACLSSNRPFGVVLIRAGQEVGGQAEPYLVGTAVRIREVFTFEDGRMDLHVQGERRFRIRSFDESGPYLVGKVEEVHELPYDENPLSEALVSQAREMFEKWFELRYASSDIQVRVEFPPEWTKLSFAIANFLELENLDKQRLLETTDTLDRIESLMPYMERQITEGKRSRWVRTQAPDLSEWVTPN